MNCSLAATPKPTSFGWLSLIRRILRSLTQTASARLSSVCCERESPRNPPESRKASAAKPIKPRYPGENSRSAAAESPDVDPAADAALPASDAPPSVASPLAVSDVDEGLELEVAERAIEALRPVALDAEPPEPRACGPNSRLAFADGVSDEDEPAPLGADDVSKLPTALDESLG